jgi:hypothetical protein
MLSDSGNGIVHGRIIDPFLFIWVALPFACPSLHLGAQAPLIGHVSLRLGFFQGSDAVPGPGALADCPPIVPFAVCRRMPLDDLAALAADATCRPLGTRMPTPRALALLGRVSSASRPPATTRLRATATSGRVSAMLMVATAVEERLMIVGDRRAWAPPTARGAQKAGAENAPALPQRPARIRAMAGRCILAVQSEPSCPLSKSRDNASDFQRPSHLPFGRRIVFQLPVQPSWLIRLKFRVKVRLQAVFGYYLRGVQVQI